MHRRHRYAVVSATQKLLSKKRTSSPWLVFLPLSASEYGLRIYKAATKNFLRELVVPEDNPNIEYNLLSTPLVYIHVNITLSIIAVHGLNATGAESHAYKTWTADGPDGKLWLKDFLPEALPKARILIFGYNANVKAQASTAGVQEQAGNLLNWLHTEPKRKVFEYPSMFWARC
jgi:hypothetical protein